MSHFHISKPIRQGRRYIHDLGNGLWLDGAVSPWVFAFSNYPLQVNVTIRRGTAETFGDAFAADRRRVANAREHDVSRLLLSVRTIPCRLCSQPAFDPTTVATTRNGLCDRCFLAVLDAKLGELRKQEQQGLARRDRRMRSHGMTVRVTGRVHPELGNDYESTWYFHGRPPLALIRRLLHREGSTIVDDFHIVTL